MALSVRRNHRVVDARIVAEMRRHAEAGEPRVEESGETSGFVLVDENGVGGAAAPCLVDLLSEQLERFVPANGLKLSVAPHHRAAITIGVVQPLKSGLSASAQCAPIHRMVGIAFELDRAPVASLGDQAAGDRALAASRRVVRRDARNGLIGRYEIRYELLDFLRGAAEHRRRGSSYAENLEELPALHPVGCVRGGRNFSLGAHATSSDTRRSRIARGTAGSTVRCDS